MYVEMNPRPGLSTGGGGGGGGGDDIHGTDIQQVVTRRVNLNFMPTCLFDQFPKTTFLLPCLVFLDPRTPLLTPWQTYYSLPTQPRPYYSPCRPTPQPPVVPLPGCLNVMISGPLSS